jgi:ABC-2 type transport system ATP-binding protein
MSAELIIDVSRLTRRFGRVTAVDELSFTVGQREIVGFLGPNGAGKSTTLRILAGFLPATSGSARVAGFDVFRDSTEVRRRIGYMPENNPLPPEMRVREYLKFRARLKGLHGNLCRERVDLVQEQCGLRDVGRRIIGTLSKGYRQRVGLADALVHDPPLLILDEPTIGLDPNQIRSLRQLIKDLGQRRSVLLSSHILPEVEMTCTRVLIMHRGSGAGGGNDVGPAERDERRGAGRGGDCGAGGGVEGLLGDHAGAGQLQRRPRRRGVFPVCALTPANGTDLRDRIYDEARNRGWRLRELTFTRHSLEDIFVHLTRTERPEE